MAEFTYDRLREYRFNKTKINPKENCFFPWDNLKDDLLRIFGLDSTSRIAELIKLDSRIGEYKRKQR